MAFGGLMARTNWTLVRLKVQEGQVGGQVTVRSVITNSSTPRCCGPTGFGATSVWVPHAKRKIYEMLHAQMVFHQLASIFT